MSVNISSGGCPPPETGGGAGETKNNGWWWWRKKVLDVEESKTQAMLALPVILTHVCYYFIPSAALMFAGHLGELELAGSTFANSWATVTGFAFVGGIDCWERMVLWLATMIGWWWNGGGGDDGGQAHPQRKSLLIPPAAPLTWAKNLITLRHGGRNQMPRYQSGLSGSLETLCGQGYGAKQYGMLGIHLQASCIISFFFSILISVSWFYSGPILMFLHQDPHISEMAALYLKYLIPGLFAYGFLENILRFLQAQSVVKPLIPCSVIPLIFHIGITYVLVHKTALGFKGAAMAVSVSLWISVFVVAIYVLYGKRFERTWDGFSLNSFHYVLINLKLALPSAAMICVNTESITYMTTYGFCAAASTRVANELGADNPNRAKNAMSVALKLSVLLALAVVLALVLGHDTWAGFYSHSSDIVKKFGTMTPLLVISIMLDSLKGVLLGVARGCGWQYFATYINLTMFFFIGMPIAGILGFKLKLRTKANMHSCKHLSNEGPVDRLDLRYCVPDLQSFVVYPTVVHRRSLVVAKVKQRVLGGVGGGGERRCWTWREEAKAQIMRALLLMLTRVLLLHSFFSPHARWAHWREIEEDGGAKIEEEEFGDNGYGLVKPWATPSEAQATHGSDPVGDVSWGIRVEASKVLGGAGAKAAPTRC
ncbi:unnamed protein product [Ilex paraguariensis]|uniref:Protein DETOXIFICATION n=1 Tax=Ilex paraguariensis TaxID=185542 RepID=A0ABC8R0M9_9AQUA